MKQRPACRTFPRSRKRSPAERRPLLTRLNPEMPALEPHPENVVGAKRLGVGQLAEALQGPILVLPVVVLSFLFAASPRLFAQSNTRLLLAAGSGVPGHAGIAFGPFSDLAMNDNRQIA